MAPDYSLPLPVAPRPVTIRPLVLPLAAAAALIGILVSTAVLATYNYQREREAARLEALSDLRAGQVANWVADKLAQVRFAGNSPLGELFLRWRQEGDTGARDRLISRLSSFQKASGGHSVLILDDRGDTLATEGTPFTPSSAQLKSAAVRAIGTNRPQFTGFYGQGGPAPAPRMDVISPLYLSGSPARGLVVLRLDPNDALFPMLRQWPVPSQTANALLVRRDGDLLVGAFGRERLPITAPNLLAAKVLRGDAPFGKAVEALDFRGNPVLGVVRPVAGTDWFLVAKIDRSEVYAEARRNAAWIAAAGLLALAAAAAAAYWWRERSALGHARREGLRQEANHQRLEQLVAQRTRELAAKNQSLERTVRDLDAFGASISHDLRGPLSTVNGFATMLARTEGHKLSEEGRRKLDRVLTGAKAMNRMIEDILACARAERVEMHFVPVDLNALAQEVLHERKAAYPHTQINVGPLPVVRADETLARQILTNLIDNALKFSARQTQPRVDIGMHGAADRPSIFIRDNGVGFDASEARKLFVPFQRLHSGGDFTGTGVGLSIVKRLVERHGGSVQAQSDPGRETTFTFDFGPTHPEHEIGHE